MNGKVAYLNFSVVENTLFSYYDPQTDDRVEVQFDPMEPHKAIEAIASIIQKCGIEKVICNKIGYGLCGSISQYLRTTYNNASCFFELNDN